MAKLFVDPFADAVMLAVWLLVTAVDVTAKLADEAPAGIVIDAGAETAVLLLRRETTCPFDGAAAFSVTVHESD